ncbi:hypothetical protein QCA50_010152 [Cerrena zonata]|uniref:Uncharacterized protein n=1 Tax=Cerrena zonata TaxID=2478898 RepID=A0AAW0G4V6_9APHY
MASDPIPFTKASLDLNVQFRLDGLGDFFALPKARTIQTRTIAPGFRFKLSSESRDNKSKGGRSIAIVFRILPDPENLCLPLHLSLVCKSLSGHKTYKDKTIKKPEILVHRVNQSWGIGILYKLEYDKDPLLQKDDAVMVEISLCCEPITEHIVSNPSLDLVRRYRQQAQPSYSDRDLRFIAYSSVRSHSKLNSPRTLYCSSDVLRKYGIDVHKLEETGLASTVQELDDENLEGQYEPSPEMLEEDSDMEYAESELEMDEDKDKDKDDEDIIVAESEELATTQQASHSKVEDQDDDMSGRPVNETIATKLSKPTPVTGVQTMAVTAVAADTWEAFLHWLYTGQIMFAPLLRSDNRQRFIEVYMENNPDMIRPCSCRSMYHIAAKLDIPPLKAIALRFFKEFLTKDIAFDELFDEFSAKYPEVKDITLNVVVQNWTTIRNTGNVEQKMTLIASGGLPHAGPIVAELLKRAAL